MFNVPQDEAPFVFNYNGKHHTLPALRSLPLPTALAINKATEGKEGKELQDAMLEAMLGIFDEYVPGITDELSMSQFAALVTAYLGDGETMGESSASSD